MTRGRKTAVFSVVGLFLLLAAVGYCFRDHQGGDAPIQKKSAVPPGTLTGVTYSHTSGMVARADFAITLSPVAILETSYYPALDPDTAEDEEWYHPSTKENVPITAAQWSDVEQIILELYPLMEPIPENRREVKLPPGIEVMDGGDSTSLILTWSTEDGTRSIRYNPPNDRRIHTLIALLEELADWTGDPPLCPAGAERLLYGSVRSSLLQGLFLPIRPGSVCCVRRGRPIYPPGQIYPVRSEAGDLE